MHIQNMVNDDLRCYDDKIEKKYTPLLYAQNDRWFRMQVVWFRY